MNQSNYMIPNWIVYAYRICNTFIFLLPDSLITLSEPILLICDNYTSINNRKCLSWIMLTICSSKRTPFTLKEISEAVWLSRQEGIVEI